MVDTLRKLMETNYEGFVKALITLETGIDNKNLLSELYEKYMSNDDIGLINDYFVKEIACKLNKYKRRIN
jgi:hypothetical protein